MVKCLNHVLRGHGHKPVAKIARSDFTVRTAFELLGDISIEGFDSSTFQGHMLLIPVWQSITDEPVQNHHIALCDGSTILSPDDFVFFNEHDEGQVRKTFHMDPHNHHHHKWYYFPQQTRDEALIFTQYNSDASSQHRHTFRWVHSQSSPSFLFVTTLISSGLCVCCPMQPCLPQPQPCIPHHAHASFRLATQFGLVLHVPG